VQKHAKTHFQLLQASVTSGELEMFPDILNIPNRNMAQQHFTLPQDHQVGRGTFLRKAGTLVDKVGPLWMYCVWIGHLYFKEETRKAPAVFIEGRQYWFQGETAQCQESKRWQLIPSLKSFHHVQYTRLIFF
jgi:hypothetical protein